MAQKIILSLLGIFGVTMAAFDDTVVQTLSGSSTFFQLGRGLAIQDDYLMLGTGLFDGASNNDVGLIKIYKKDGSGDFIEKASFDGDDYSLAQSSKLGEYCDFAGDTLLCHENDFLVPTYGTVGGGKIRVWKTLDSGETWVDDQTFLPTTFPANAVASGAASNFGQSFECSDDGQWCFVGAGTESSDDGSTATTGAVYLFEKVGGTYVQSSRIASPEITSGARLGYNVAISHDGTWAAANMHSISGLAVSKVVFFKNVGGTLVQQNIITEPTSDTTSKFGHDMKFSRDGSYIALSEPMFENDGGSVPYNTGRIYVAKVASDTWSIVDTVTLLDPSPHTNTQPAGDNLARQVTWGPELQIFVGAPGYDDGNSNAGGLFVIEHIGTDDWNNTEIVLTGGTSVSNGAYGYSVVSDGLDLIVSARGEGSNNGKVYKYALPAPPCFATSDCSSTYCQPNNECAISAKACSSHGDCFGEFLSGYLPHCDFDAGVCKDVGYHGICTSVPECTAKVKKQIANANAIGSMTQTASIGGNVTQSRLGVNDIIQDTIATTTITQDLEIFVAGVETAVFDGALFTNVNNDNLILAEIQKLVCAGDAEEACSVTIPARRVLEDGRELQQEITVSVSYELDAETFANLTSSGSFNDPAFAQALADAVGADVSDVTVVAVDGTLEIEYIVSQESTGDDPLEEENLNAIDTLASEVDTITDTVVAELGLDAGDYEEPDVDKCGDRDCNGRGTCNANTGVCACTDPDYWGINCETSVTCGNGTKSDSSAYCICDYPEYGQRCENNKDCSACGV